MSRAEALIARAEELKATLGADVHDGIAETTFAEATRLADAAVKRRGRVFDWDWKLDRVLTSRIWGFPIMMAILALVFYLTIKGANVPSKMIADGLFWVEDQLAFAFQAMSAPAWHSYFSASLYSTCL